MAENRAISLGLQPPRREVPSPEWRTVENRQRGQEDTPDDRGTEDWRERELSLRHRALVPLRVCTAGRVPNSV